MLNDDDRPLRLRSFDLTNVGAQAADDRATGDDGPPDDIDDAVGRSDDRASRQR